MSLRSLLTKVFGSTGRPLLTRVGARNAGSPSSPVVSHPAAGLVITGGSRMLTGLNNRLTASITPLLTKLGSKMKSEKKDRVAVLRLAGMIADGRSVRGRRINFQSLSKEIDASFALKDVKAVCLQINSPGGSPVQSELICKRWEIERWWKRE